MKILVLVGLLAACGGGGDDAADVPDAAAPDATITETTPIYVNRGGGTYTAGANDARANTSTILDVEAVLGPYVVDDTRWEAQLTCLRAMFAPFNVAIVDDDPGDVPHLEVVMVPAADWSQVIDQATVSGLSPFTCAPIANAIVFMNPEYYDDNDYDICWTTAQVAANSTGLDHAFSCPDVMTYLDSCGDTKTFTDEDVACGEYEARTCCTGEATQNSFAHLTDVFGAAL